MARRGRKSGQIIRYEDLPPVLVHAVTAIEDRRFFDHFGIDPRGLARAALANLRAGRTVQGGLDAMVCPLLQMLVGLCDLHEDLCAFMNAFRVNTPVLQRSDDDLEIPGCVLMPISEHSVINSSFE